jgi:hypothetical protein
MGRSVLVGPPVGSPSLPHRTQCFGKPRLSLKEEAEMLTSKERAVRASGVLKSPILAELACFADLYGSDLVLERSPNPDQKRYDVQSR